MEVLLGSVTVNNIEATFNDLVAFIYALLPIIAVVCIVIIAVAVLRYCLMVIWAITHRSK